MNRIFQFIRLQPFVEFMRQPAFARLIDERLVDAEPDDTYKRMVENSVRPGTPIIVLYPVFSVRYKNHVSVLLRARMNIREFRQIDVPRLQELWIEFMDYHSDFDPDFKRSENAETNWVSYIHSKFDKASETVFVAIEDAVIVGYVGVVVREYPPIFTIKNFGFIEEIAVTSNFRRRGIASQLLLAAEDWLQERGITQIRVNIDLANNASKGFFRSHGYLNDTETLLKKV